MTSRRGYCDAARTAWRRARGGPTVALMHSGGGADALDPTVEKNWLVHVMTPSAWPGHEKALLMPDYVSPMVATAGAERDLGEDEWVSEMTWDGIRAIALIGPAGDARLVTRNRNDVTPSYPKILAGLAAALVGDSGSLLVLDGEIVAVDRNGRPNFGLLQTRVNLGAPEARAAVSRVSVHYLLIDVLEQDDRSLRGESYDTRRRALEGVLAPARATAPTRSAFC